MAKDTTMLKLVLSIPFKWLKASTLFFVVLLGSATYAQTDSLEAKLCGSWILTNHQIEAYMGDSNLASDELILEYIFEADGSYKLTSSNFYEDEWHTVVTVGQWYLDIDPLRIELYDNLFLPPHDERGRSADHPVLFKFLSDSEISVEEFLFFEGEPGQSTYTKKQ